MIKQEKQEIPFDFDELLENWPSPIVPRNSIEKFSGGLINQKYLANLDSSNRGIPGRFRVGRLVCYPARNVVNFIKNRASAIVDTN
ncbi:MAG: hypothetical protein KKD92_14000 [Proteobacteria bacterium]|nr:hypothetical protein [Pseudomonadota bacterium]